MEMSDIVREVREYIEKHGWCKGTAGNSDGEVCIWGAYWILDARVGYWGKIRSFRNAVGAGLPSFREGVDPIVEFNDDPATTIEDVILHLKRVEARLEAGS